MPESNEVQIAQLLQQGLEAYGAGDFSRAFLAWNEVLELDPGNEEAMDYLRDADRREKPRDGRQEDAEKTLLNDARGLLRSGGAESALEFLMSADTSGQFECEAMIELLRATLYQQYQGALGDPMRVPRVLAGMETEMRNRNLPASAGFLLSMIDGETPLCDLVSLSGMDRIDAMRLVSGMFGAGILEWVE